MKKNLLFGMGALLIVAVACSKSDDVEEVTNEPNSTEEEPAKPTYVEPKTRVDIVMTPQESVVNDAANQFSLKFFEQMVKNSNAGSNIFVSPFSAQAALSMTANGARNETLDEMLTALNMKGFGLDDINQYNQTIIKAIADLDNTTFVESANGIWSKVNLLESFSSKMQEVYDAKVEKTDFSREALIAINDWASEKTHGMIPELYNVDEGVSPYLMVVLANALYFNAVWKEPFYKELTTKGSFFTTGKDGAIPIDMMKEGGYRNYLQCETFDLCEKPYGNGAFSMVFLLPHESIVLSQCISDLAKKDWNTLTTSLEKSYSLVNLTVPKFEWKDLQYDLIPSLKAMGMQVPFTGNADFRNMTDEADLLIGAVDQYTALTLNEQGTQAAAITKVEVEATSNGGEEPNPVDFTLNRPFALLIKEKSTGVILFAGAVNNVLRTN